MINAQQTKTAHVAWQVEVIRQRRENMGIELGGVKAHVGRAAQSIFLESGPRLVHYFAALTQGSLVFRITPDDGNRPRRG